MSGEHVVSFLLSLFLGAIIGVLMGLRSRAKAAAKFVRVVRPAPAASSVVLCEECHARLIAQHPRLVGLIAILGDPSPKDIQ